MEQQIQNAIARIMVGVSQQSTADCDWYEGIQFDGAHELVADGVLKSDEVDGYIEYCEARADIEEWPLTPAEWREFNGISA
jgi:hypothetical protein